MTMKSRLGRLEKLAATKAATDAGAIDVPSVLIDIALADVDERDNPHRSQQGDTSGRILPRAESTDDRQRIRALIRADWVAVDCCVALALAPWCCSDGPARYAVDLRSSDCDHTAVLAALESADPWTALLDLIAERIGERIEPVAQKTGQNETTENATE